MPIVTRWRNSRRSTRWAAPTKRPPIAPSLAGNQPNPTGLLTRQSHLFRTVSGADAVLAASYGLESAWPLDSLFDSYKNLTLTNNGGATFSTGKIGNAVYLDSGVPQYLITEYLPSPGDTDFIAACWAWLDSTAYSTAFTQMDNAYEWDIYYNTGRWRFYIEGGASNGEAVANTFGDPGTGSWHLIVGVHDSVNNLISISVDGGVWDSVAYSGGVRGDDFPILIGAEMDGTGALDGRVDSAWRFLSIPGGAAAKKDAIRDWLWNGGSGREYPDLPDAQPAPTGVLTAFRGIARSLAGNQPNPTGLLTRQAQEFRSLAGNQPAPTGGLTSVTATGTRRAIVTWVEVEAPFAVRTLTGNQPNPSGTLTRSVGKTRSLTGNQPFPTGLLTRGFTSFRSLTGNQPSSTGLLTRIKTAPRALTGNQPFPTGLLTRLKQAPRALAGDQPFPTGLLTRKASLLRALTGNLPAMSATLARGFTVLRSLTGNQPFPTGVLARFKVSPRTLTGNQPAPSGVLTFSIVEFVTTAAKVIWAPIRRFLVQHFGRRTRVRAQYRTFTVVAQPRTMDVTATTTTFSRSR